MPFSMRCRSGFATCRLFATLSCCNGVSRMTALNVLSGGAAHGLIESLKPQFNSLTGACIEGLFGAVGAMADKLRKGHPADLVVLTAAMIADLTKEDLVVPSSVSDVGLVETAIAVRANDPLISAKDGAGLRAAFLAAD